MVVALILLLVVVASVLFHLTSPWWFSPLASNWGYMDTTIIITFWITGVVFVAIGLMFGALGLQKWVALRSGGSADDGDDDDAG